MRWLFWCSAVLLASSCGGSRDDPFAYDHSASGAHARFFFQAGTADDHVPHAQLLALMRAAPGHSGIRWYHVAHVLSKQIDEDLVAWMADALR